VVLATLGGMHVPQVSTIMLLFQSANGDTQLFECQGDINGDRANARKHVAFGAR
jgi:cytochrome P450